MKKHPKMFSHRPNWRLIQVVLGLQILLFKLLLVGGELILLYTRLK